MLVGVSYARMPQTQQCMISGMVFDITFCGEFGDNLSLEFLIRDAGVTTTVRFGDLRCELCKHWPASKQRTSCHLHSASSQRVRTVMRRIRAEEPCSTILSDGGSRMLAVVCQVLKHLEIRKFDQTCSRRAPRVHFGPADDLNHKAEPVKAALLR